jgi:nitroimidazol reductase NimA-like FMN-containing flavoprotein (pyridoxamine 5'-phosphate oxidase superfamily)
METFAPTERTTLKRLAKRGNFDRDVVYGILDEAFICHVGFIVEGRPVVIPTAYGRVGDRFYLHGSAANRMLRTAETGVDICVTVTLVDGLVLARSAFHHSINYRSVVIFGRASVVEDSREKFEALRSFTQHVVPSRWADVREPTDSELKATIVLYLELMEVSAKVRTGPPIDDEEDYAMPVWAGEIPLRLVAGVPIPDPRLAEGIDPPQYVSDYSRTVPDGDPT